MKGVTVRLDYLKELGVDVLWLTPVYKSPNFDNGYDISDYCDIMDEAGTMEDWEELLDEVHKRGMKLIMDLVINHTSDEHEWFTEARSSKENPYRDYYIWHSGKNGREPNNWASHFSPSAWEWDEKTVQYYLHLFSVKQPDLNWKNRKLRHEIYNMMKWWLDKGIDGFRMEVINAIAKAEGFPDAPRKEGDNSKYVFYQPMYFNQPEVHEILQEMNSVVLDGYDIMTVGETPCVTPEEAIRYVAEDRKELNMIFQFELNKIDDGPGGRWDTVPWKLEDFKIITKKWQLGLQGKGWNSLYLNNHDPRIVSRFGNDREYRTESAKLLATYIHTLQGHQGEEIGMTNVKFEDIEKYNDIDIHNFYDIAVNVQKCDSKEVMRAILAKGRDNARTPVQWSGKSNAGFSEGKPWIDVNPNYTEINVENSLIDENSIYHYYRKLIKLRKENLVMVYGKYVPIMEEHEQIFAYLRCLKEEGLLVIMNFSEGTPVFDLPAEFTFKDCSLLISNYEVNEHEVVDSFKLKPYEARVYKLSLA